MAYLSDIVSSLHSLSFYKEFLSGETNNYVNMRALAECKSPIVVLEEMAAEMTDTVGRINAITVADPELAMITMRFIQVGAPLTLRWIRRMP